jgi:uncharacterized protein (UPF0261 family)
MDLRIFNVQPGDLILILDGNDERADVAAQMAEAKEQALVGNSVALVIASGGAMYADIVVDGVSGQPVVVKNRRGSLLAR